MERKAASQSTRWMAGKRRFCAACRMPSLLAILLAAEGLPTAPAKSQSVSAGSRQTAMSSDADQPRGLNRSYRHKLMLMANAARQKEIISDAEKLVRLAAELDAEVRAAGDRPPSPAQLDKIARIQKLAHNVKEKIAFTSEPY